MPSTEDSIHVSGAISPAAVGDIVSVYAQPFGQASFVKIADVQTTTNGVWDLITTPQVLTSYKATWKGKTSAVVTVAVQPQLRLRSVGNWFVAHAQPDKYGGHWLYVQRANAFGEWVSLKKVTLNSQSATRFKLRNLPHGLNRLRLFISTNQAGSGYFHGASPTHQLPAPLGDGRSRRRGRGPRGVSACLRSRADLADRFCVALGDR